MLPIASKPDRLNPELRLARHCTRTRLLFDHAAQVYNGDYMNHAVLFTVVGLRDDEKEAGVERYTVCFFAHFSASQGLCTRGYIPHIGVLIQQRRVGGMASWLGCWGVQAHDLLL